MKPQGWYLYRLARLLGAPLYLSAHLKSKRRSLLPLRFSPPQISSSRVLWVHTLSVGEVNAALPLLKALRDEFPTYFLVFTVATASGYLLARKKVKDLVDLLWPGPLDLPLLASRYIDHLRPKAFILVETDLWPGILWEIKRRGIPLLWANAAISSRAYSRLKRSKILRKLLLGPFDFIGAATGGDARRLKKLLPEQEIFYFGNLKFENKPPEPEKVEDLSRKLRPFLKKPLLVCGSTHPGEEEIIFEALKRLDIGAIICPRDPQRAPEIKKLAERMGFKASLRSRPERCKILIVDTLGELKFLYGLGEVAFVGGSLVPVGGHNLLEPLQHGTPLLIGPHLESVEDLAEVLLKEGLAFLVKDAPSLMEGWTKALKIREETKIKAPKVCQFYQNSSAKYAKILKKMLNN